MKIREVTITGYRGWPGPTTWKPGTRSVLIGPNNGGKSSLLRAIDLVLDPHRNPYRSRLAVYDFYELDTTSTIGIQVVLDELDESDCDIFEEYLEGQRADGSFGGFDNPADEFDDSALVLRLAMDAEWDQPAAPYFARPDAGGTRVTQEHRLRIGWRLVPASLDPLHELAFYSDSVMSRLIVGADIRAELDTIRQAIEGARGPLLAQQEVGDARRRLEQTADRLGLSEGDDPLDLQVLGLTDRRVLQSFEWVLRGREGSEHLPLPSHGGGVLRALLLAAVLQAAQATGENLILAIEEPEQNLEPINQRLITRSLLMREDSGASQILLTTHASTVAGSVPLRELHLVRRAAVAQVSSLTNVALAEHKFFERHARGPLIDAMYADCVLLIEGPTERGGLPEFWRKRHLDDGLDERRIEVVECESVGKMPPWVRFFAALGIPTVALCDCDPDKAHERAAILQEGAGLLIHWGAHHEDWEGMLAAEADENALVGAMQELMDEYGGWDRHGPSLCGQAEAAAPGATHLPQAVCISDVVNGYVGVHRQQVLRAMLKGKSPGFKSSRDQRLIAEALPTVPKRLQVTMLLVREVAARNAEVTGEIALS